jgi:DNA mismatch endonuclease, patch repair protein
MVSQPSLELGSNAMADRMTKAQRSRTMSRIRSSGNVSTELLLIRLFRMAGIKGWRRKATLAGKPDFVFPKERVAVFADGCFWHRCPRCFKAPKSNRSYWKAKIDGNIRRDKQVNAALRAAGWRVLRLREHSIRENPYVCIRQVASAVGLRNPQRTSKCLS